MVWEGSGRRGGEGKGKGVALWKGKERLEKKRPREEEG